MSEAVRAWLGLGSNLDDPPAQLLRAIDALAELPDTELLGASSLYRSPPLDGSEQPYYCNAVVAITTRLPAAALLGHCQAIEAAQGRLRDGEHWAARTLDVDILLYANQCIDSARLTVPHVGLLKRNFVIQPLLELAPDLTIPLPNGEQERLANYQSDDQALLALWPTQYNRDRSDRIAAPN